MSTSVQLITLLSSQNFKQLLDLLKLPKTNELLPKTQEDPDLVITIETLLHKSIQLLLINGAQSAVCEDLTIFDEIVYECCRLLRNSCAVGTPIQNQIAEFSTDPHTIFDIINLILKSNEILKPKTRKMCWQFVANLGVQNVLTQRQIWYKCIEQIVNTLKCVCETENSRECTMILYNLCIGQILCTNDIKQIIELLLQCSIEQHALGDNDFHQLIMEYIITDYRSIAPAYDRIASADKQFYLISHIIDHMKTMKHQPISTPLLQFICKEFKKRSDYLLNVNGTSIPNTTRPQEVVAMLEVIALASSDERYAHVLATDHSLFINVGCLLRSIHKLGNCNSSDGHNIFTPIRKLGQFAPNPIKDRSIERDISYQLKSMLIRILANLAYKNKKNQDLAREMEFIPIILDSTVLDARNPLIKEWSIFAIRNLCESNMENQQIIGQLSKIGDATSDNVKEFNIDLGSLRINPDV